MKVSEELARPARLGAAIPESEKGRNHGRRSSKTRRRMFTLWFDANIDLFV